MPLLDDAFVGAARLTGFSALVFVLFGFGISLLLPETRLGELGELDGTDGGGSAAPADPPAV